MQYWQKLGLLFDKTSYAAVPIVYQLDTEHLIRVYFSSRDNQNRSIPCFVDIDLNTMSAGIFQALNVPLGNLGSFDEHGIMPTSILLKDKQVWMYYIGWNLGKTVPFRNSLGLLISKDSGHTFEKFSEGPILDRGIYDKCFVASNYVYSEEDFYRMYYLSCNKWEKINGKLQHSYNIKYAESKDAINWRREGKVAVDFRFPTEYAISAPRVYFEHGIYKMWYSYRGGPDTDTYRIGYAESTDGIIWTRKDELVSLDVSTQDWDSQMLCYPYIFDWNRDRYMLYNGNGYGKTGFGIAKLKS